MSLRPVDPSGGISRRLSNNMPTPEDSLRDEMKIDALIREISVNFKELLTDDANTLETALALMDSSSIGKNRYQGDFDEFKDKLQQTLKYHVDKNYHGFNTAIGSYRTVVQTVTDSQAVVDSTKNLLVEARADLATRRPILKSLRQASLKYKQMVEIIDMVDSLKNVPDTFESQIAQKKFLSAYDTLIKATITLDNESLSQISALQPIQIYVVNHEMELYHILLDEMSAHLYLKSPYTENLWSAYSSLGQDKVHNLEQVVEDKIKFDLFKETASSYSGSSVLNDFLMNFDRDKPLIEDSKRNAESDSYYYIRLLVETLAKMNRLPSAFDVLRKRMATELHALIDRTIVEVKSRAPKNFKELNKNKPVDAFKDFEEANNQVRLSVLQDFIWTLYSKMTAVLQAHRVIYEVARAFYERQMRDLKMGEGEFTDYDIFGVYEEMEEVIQSLLYSYITTDTGPDSQSTNAGTSSGTGTAASSLDTSSLEMLRLSKNRNRDLFRFENVDYERPDYLDEFETLHKTLEQNVPGLLAQTATGSFKQRLMPYAPSGLSSSHELLITPVVFNIRALLEPTVVFLQRCRAILPTVQGQRSKATEPFLDKFLEKYFLPQLEQSLQYSFREIVSEPNAFVPDAQWAKISKKPLLNAFINYIRLIQTACHLMNTGFMYREKYATLIITTIKWLSQTLNEKYQGMVEVSTESDNPTSTTATGTITHSNKQKSTKKLAAVLLESKDSLREVLDLLAHDPHAEKAALLQQEAFLFASKRHGQKLNDAGTVQFSDLLDIDIYYSMALLATSLRWTVVKLQKIRRVKQDDSALIKQPDEKSGRSSLQARMRKRWTLLEVSTNNSIGKSTEVPDITHDPTIMDASRLILADKCLENFDAAVKGLERLADLCVMTLRTDLRLRTLYYMDKTFAESNYYLSSNSEERDSYIGALDSAIIKCDDSLSTSLTSKDRDFCFSGLSYVMNELLVKEADSIEAINKSGYTKMQYNILALQQMLKSIVSDPNEVDFSRAGTFYKSVTYTPSQLLETAKQKPKGFDCDDFKVLNKLIYSGIVKQHEHNKNREAASAAKSACLEQQMRIHNIYYG